MVKQADHNSPRLKGQSGVEGRGEVWDKEEFTFLQFYWCRWQLRLLDKFAMVSSPKLLHCIFFLLEAQWQFEALSW